MLDFRSQIAAQRLAAKTLPSGRKESMNQLRESPPGSRRLDPRRREAGPMSSLEAVLRSLGAGDLGERLPALPLVGE